MPNTARLIRLTHAVFGIVVTLAADRALVQPWLAQNAHDAAVASAIRVVFPVLMLAGTLFALLLGLRRADAATAFRTDTLSVLAVFAAIFFLSLGDVPRDVVGLVFVLVVVVRLLPTCWSFLELGAPAIVIFALCLVFYASIGTWRVAASLPLGDQVFYLMSAEDLARGSLDATLDRERFVSILGITPGPADAAAHVVASPAGPRLVQGYALPVLLAPGWLLAGQLGATLVIGVFAAWAATETWRLFGDLGLRSASARCAWMLTAFAAPLTLVAAHIYPNAIGAALTASAYRRAFTAPQRRPMIAAALLGAALLLNPRDGVVLAVLVPFMLRWYREERWPIVLVTLGATVVASVVDLVTFGVPLPYAGYILGAPAAQTIDPQPTWNFQFWVALPAIFFDRVFGIAGTAPWILLAALGVPTVLRSFGSRMVPAAGAVAASIAVLSAFRLWEGGYAPANRYLVDVLPLVAPFVAIALDQMRSRPPLIAFAVVVIAVSALGTLTLLAIPSAQLNTAFEAKPRELISSLLGLDPLGWLPSFQPTRSDWWIGAYLRTIPAAAIVALLTWIGWRRAHA